MKRSAENQLTKDIFESENGDASNATPGEGFSKAAPDVLAKRRIVKVRRTAGPKQSSDAPVESKPNPFATVSTTPPSGTDGSGVETKTVTVTATVTAAAEEETQKESVELKTVTNEPSNGEKPVDKAPDENISETQTDGKDPKAENTVKSNEKNVQDTVNQEPEASKTEEVAPVEAVDNAPDTDPVKPVEKSNVSKQEAPVGNEKDDPPAPSPNTADDAAKASDAPAEATVPKGENVDPKNVQVGTASKVETESTGSSAPKRTPFTFGGTAGSSTTPFASFAEAAAAEKSKQPFSFSVPDFPAGEKPSTVAPFGASGGAAAGHKFKPAPVTTGEENEREVFRTSKAKLYEFEEKQWKNRGEGTFKMNVPKSDGKPRLLMRREGTLQLVLNSPIFPGFKLNRTGERGVTFKNTETDKVVTVKFSSRDDVGRLEKLIEEWKEKL